MPNENPVVLSRATAAIAMALLERDGATFAVVRVDAGPPIILTLPYLDSVADKASLVSTARVV